jgi:hypothetical protein
MGLETKNECAGEGKQQIIVLLNDQQSVNNQLGQQLLSMEAVKAVSTSKQ